MRLGVLDIRSEVRIDSYPHVNSIVHDMTFWVTYGLRISDKGRVNHAPAVCTYSLELTLPNICLILHLLSCKVPAAVLHIVISPWSCLQVEKSVYNVCLSVLKMVLIEKCTGMCRPQLRVHSHGFLILTVGWPGLNLCSADECRQVSPHNRLA